MASDNEARRRRYAESPKLRKKAQARCRAYRRANKAKIAEKRRLDRKQHPEKMKKKRIEYTYGLSWDECPAILARQGGVCAMCKTKSKRPLCVDHCHKTGMVRGILCSPCNLTIGLCRDSTKITRAATAYLEAAQKRIRRKMRGKKKKRARPSSRHAGGRRPVAGDQSGRTSAPIRPQAVQTIRGQSARTTVSSGSQSASRFARWLHQVEAQ